MAGEYKEVFRKLLLAEIKDEAKLKRAEEECLAQVRKGVNTNIIAFLKEKGLISASKYEPLVRQYNKLLKEENRQTEEAVEPKVSNTFDLEGKIESPPTVQEGDTGRIKTLASKIKNAGKNIDDMDDALTIHPKEHTDTIDPDEIFGEPEAPAKEYPRTVAPSITSPAKEAAPARHKEIFDKTRYKYVKVIGKGGMGVVELYKDSKFGIDVAVKHLLAKDITQQRKDRFGREMRLQGRFAGNPHVVRALDLGYDEKNDLYFVMEFVRGKTLKDKIEEIDAEKVKDNYLLMSWLDLFTKIVETVGKVHDKDIIHRDIKPDNVMILDE